MFADYFDEPLQYAFSLGAPSTDVVELMNIAYLGFSREAKKKATEELFSMQPCSCKPRRVLRVPRCTCSRREHVSPLLQIRWKRLVVDEGHNTAEKRTDYAIFTKLLSVERRWIVTGTPTSKSAKKLDWFITTSDADVLTCLHQRRD